MPTMAGGNNNNVSKPAAAKTAAIPASWGDVGKLNIDLDNLSLHGRNQTKKSVPMNAMKTSPNTSPMSPTGGNQMGIAPAQPQQQFMSNNDLL